MYNLILKYETKMIYGLDKECNFVTIPIIGKKSSEIRFIIQITLEDLGCTYISIIREY